MHKLLNWTRRLCLSNAQNTHHVRSPFSYTLSHKWLLVPPEVVLHRRTHTDFSSYVQYPIEMFNSHKIKLHVPLYHLSPFMKVFDWIVRKCHNRYSFMISSIVMFYVFSYFSQHDDLLTTSSVTLQHMMWFSFTTTTSFYCYKIIRMESGNRTTTKQIFSWSINEDVLLVQTLWNLNRN